MNKTQQKQEAIERIKMLQIHKTTIKEFDEENIVISPKAVFFIG